MMLDPSTVPLARSMVATGDFYGADHQVIFDAVVACWLAGDSYDMVVVLDQLRRAGTLEQAGGPSKLAQIMSSTPSTSAAGRYAEVVGRLAHLRRLLTLSVETAADAWNPGSDPEALVDRLREGLISTASTAVGLPADVASFDDWITEDHEAKPWVVPALFREQWRIIVVGEEGTGKSVGSRQVALCAAQGIHPFVHTNFPPVNTLLVDLENPDEAIADTGGQIQRQLRLMKGEHYREHGCWIWHRPAGLDLRRRAHRAQFDAILTHVRPKLVCLGPMYRAFTKRGKEDHEGVAEEVQSVLDDLRTRHGFAIMLEHHAPKAQSGKRDLVPFGSSLWQRWPDMGITLRKDPDVHGALKVGRYRGDRVKARWPNRLDRGRVWPWSGYYEDGFLDSDTDVTSTT